MSKLGWILSELKSNPGAVIVKAEERKFRRHLHGCADYLADLWVAPSKGIYSANELQRFMTRLIPILKPADKDDFWEDDETFAFGRMYFDEKLAKKRWLTEKGLAGSDERVADESSHGRITFECTRRICVAPFPDEVMAKDILEGKLEPYSEFFVSPKDVRRYKYGLFDEEVLFDRVYAAAREAVKGESGLVLKEALWRRKSCARSER